ncbi:Penicillin-binding protein, transpeptidase domain protein [Nocardioides sp. PD653]|nr:Penicillin-binding protein, transpeptidase domain protein [Nocardioides sp. PD653-B2]GAW53653.1 Penicillin-binding protein, transpeptidase domain protein [Nocardioides sp. PD653]
MGEVASESAPDLMKVAQRRLGQRGGADPASVTGYIEGFADHLLNAQLPTSVGPLEKPAPW